MAFNLSEVIAKRKVVEIPYDGETLVIGITPNKFTGEYNNRLQNLTPDERNSKEFMAQILIDFIADWDAVYEGAPFPLTVENLQLLPLPLMNAMADKVLEAIRRDPPKGENSASTSSIAAS